MNAMISGRNGVALVVDGNQLASIHVDEPGRIIPREPREIRFLIGEGRDFVPFEDISPDEIAEQLTLARAREDALMLTLILLDADVSDELRREVAEDLSGFLQRQDVLHYVESVLYAEPLPDQGDLTGGLKLAREAGATIVQNMLELFWKRQDAIAAVREAWNAMPSDTFDGERKRWQAVAVREGLFRTLVLLYETGKNVNELLIKATKIPAVRSLRNHRVVLRSWISPFVQRQTAEERERESVLEPQPWFVAEPVAEYGDHQGQRIPFDRGKVFEDVERQKQTIKKALKQRKFVRAQKIVEELIEYQLQHGGSEYAAKSLCALAMTAKELGLSRLQLEWTKRSVEIHQEDGWAWAQYADALLRVNRLDEALRAYNCAVGFGESVVARNGRAEVLKAQGRLDEALCAYEGVIQEHPESVVAGAGRAEVLKAQGRLDEALRAYEGVIQEHPENKVARNGYASTLASAHRWDEALAVLPVEPPTAFQDWIASHIRGMIYLRRRQLDRAIDILQQGINSNPWPVLTESFRTALAIAHLQQNNPEEAIEIIGEVKSPELRLPTNVVLIHAHLKNGDRDFAKSVLERLVRETPAIVIDFRKELEERILTSDMISQQTDQWFFEQECRLLEAVAA